MAKRKEPSPADLYSDIAQPAATDILAARQARQELLASTRGDMGGTHLTMLVHPRTYQQRAMKVWEAYCTDSFFARMVNRSVEFCANGAKWEVPSRLDEESWVEKVKKWMSRRKDAQVEREEEFWNTWAENLNSGVSNVLPGLQEVTRWAVKHLLLSGMFVPAWELGKMPFGKQTFLVPTKLTCYPASAITLRRANNLFMEEEMFLKLPPGAGSKTAYLTEGAPREASPTATTSSDQLPLRPLGSGKASEDTEAFALKYGWTPGDLVTMRAGQLATTGQGIYPHPPFFALMPIFAMRQRLFASDLALLDGLINYIMCVRPDQIVTTRRGHIPIAEVRVGDKVLTHKHRWRRVTQVFQRMYNGELIGLRPTNGMKGSRSCLWVTPEHPVLSRHRKKYPYWDSRRQQYRWRVPNQVGARYASSRPQEPDPPSWIAAADVDGGDLVLLPRIPREVSRDPLMLRMEATHTVEVPGGLKAQNPLWRGGTHPKARVIPSMVLVDEAMAEVIGLYLAEGGVSSSVYRYSQWNLKSKLSPEQAREVLASKESGRSLAQQLGISPTVIQRIRRGQKQFSSPQGVSRRSICGITFSFHERETDLHTFVSSVMRNAFGLAPSIARPSGSHGIQLTFSSRIVGETFAREFGEGAANKRVPPWLVDASPVITAAWVRGLFKGDGCRRPDGAWTLRIVSRELALQAVDAIRSLGMRASFGRYRNRLRVGREYREHLPVYVVRVSNRDGFDAFMSGAHSSEAGPDDMWVTTRISRRETYIGPVFNLEVEEDESYVVNGAAVHNCWRIGDDKNPPKPPVKNAAGDVVQDGTIAQVRKLIQEGRVGPALELFLPYYVNLEIKAPDTTSLLSEVKYVQSTIEIFNAFGVFFARGAAGSRERMERINVTNFEEFLAGLRHHVKAFYQLLATHIVALNPGKLTQVPIWTPNPLNTKTEAFIQALSFLAKLGKVSFRTLAKYHGLDDSVELRRIAMELGTDTDDLFDANVPTSYVQQVTRPPDWGGENPDEITETRIPPTKQQGRPKKRES